MQFIQHSGRATTYLMTLIFVGSILYLALEAER